MEVQHGFITQQMSFLSMSMPLSTNLTHITYSATNQHLVQPLTLTPPPFYGEHFQSIGNKVDGESIPLGIDEVAVGGTELSVSSGVVTDNVILTAAKACTVSIYSVQGKLINKYNV